MCIIMYWIPMLFSQQAIFNFTVQFMLFVWIFSCVTHCYKFLYFLSRLFEVTNAPNNWIQTTLGVSFLAPCKEPNPLKKMSHKTTFSLIDYDFIKWLHRDDDSRWPVANYSYVFTKHRQAAVLLQLLTLRDLHAKSVRSIKYWSARTKKKQQTYLSSKQILVSCASMLT